jgi:hypothetical protein
LSEANIVGNYFISGPSTSATAFTRGNANFHGYVENNFYDSDKDGTLNGIELGVAASNYGGMAIQTTKFAYPGPEKTLSAQDALKHVQGFVGASKARDAVDKRLVEELASWGTTGQLISDEKASPMNGPGTIAEGTKAVDTDGDGIPDDAEVELGFDATKNDATEDKDGNGYVNVEEWANSLVPASY